MRAVALLLGGMSAPGIGFTAAAATGPAAPQSLGQFDPCHDGDNTSNITVAATAGANDRSACIDPGQSLFIDPTGGNFGSSFGPCRYVTNGATKNLYVPTGLPIEYQDFRAGAQNGLTPPGVTELICCRPVNVTLCAGATGGTQSASVQGTGANGYGVFGSTGTAVATCSNAPYGSYVDERSFTCGQVGSGVMADGQWNQSGGDSEQCSPNAYSVYGACSTAGSGGWGNEYETIYNSCGQITSQGYFGPACYTQPPCTNSWSGPNYGACSTWQCPSTSGNMNVVEYYTGTCPGGQNITWSQGCTATCCAPNYQKVGCNGSTADMHDVNNCPGSVDYGQANGCTWGVVGHQWCFPFWCNGPIPPDNWIGCTCGPNGPGCGSSWHGSGDQSFCTDDNADCSGETTSKTCWGWQ